jgi:hypothetical protein
MHTTMSPRQRKPLDPRSKRFETRFAIQLRELLAKRKMTATDFIQRVQAAGVDVSAIAIRKWLSASHVPRPQDMPAIGRVLGLKDYRHLLPPPDSD